MIKEDKLIIKIIQSVALVGIAALVFQAVIIDAFSSPVPAVFAGDFCAVPVDVILLMDSSGSMNQGGSESLCEWKQYEERDGTSSCYGYEETGLTEGQCEARRSRAPCAQLTYTPAHPTKIEAAKVAAKSFIDNLGSSDQSGVVSFNTLASLAQVLSGDHEASKATIEGLTTGGATNIGDAIGLGINELGSERANPQATKTIILLTDGKANKPNGSGFGEDPADVAYVMEKAQEAAGLLYKIFTIGLGRSSDINESMLADVADLTGAKYFNSPDGDSLTGIYNEIAWEVCQYGSISGYKYQDLDNDGDIQDEETLAGWEIVLSGDAENNQLTDEDGFYSFSGLLAGNYIVSEGANSDKGPHVLTYPFDGSYGIALSAGENLLDINFANYLPFCGNEIIDEDQGEVCDGGESCTEVCTLEEGVPGPHDIDNEEDCEETGYYWYDDSCNLEPEEDEETILGCTDSDAENFDPEATEDDDSCTYPEEEQTIGPGDIVINEIMQNPQAVFDSLGEWFELYNTTGADIDLLGCTIRDDGADSHTISNSLVAPSLGYAVLARSGDSSQNGGILGAYGYSGFALANSADEVILECNGSEIDRVEYVGGPGFPDPVGASMILAQPSLDNNIGSNWCVSTSPFGAGDMGTPGSLNDVCGEEDEEPILGCTDSDAENFDPEAEEDDGSCTYPGNEPEEGAYISGHKYYDVNNNSEIDENEEGLEDWTILLEKQVGDVWEETASTTTGEGGDYLFESLEAGLYRLREFLTEGWIQTYPSEPFYWEVAVEGNEILIDINFANYLPFCGNEIIDEDQGEVCDGGESCTEVCTLEEGVPGPHDIDNEEDCEETGYYWYDDSCNLEPEEDEETILGCTDSDAENFDPEAEEDDGSCTYSEPEDGGGGNVVVLTGGGGGFTPPGTGPIGSISITSVSTTSVTITWTTNYPATSQVIYRQEGEPYTFDLTLPNYGYPHAYPDPEDTAKVLDHSVTISDLTPGVAYYYRVVSYASPPTFSPEQSFSITQEGVAEGTTDPLLEGGEEISLEEMAENAEKIRSELEKIQGLVLALGGETVQEKVTLPDARALAEADTGLTPELTLEEQADVLEEPTESDEIALIGETFRAESEEKPFGLLGNLAAISLWGFNISYWIIFLVVALLIIFLIWRKKIT